jgi:hypothetical protein
MTKKANTRLLAVGIRIHNMATPATRNANWMKRLNGEEHCQYSAEVTRARLRDQVCQPGTSGHRVHVNCISHVTLRHLLTHLGCVYNRSI